MLLLMVYLFLKKKITIFLRSSNNVLGEHSLLICKMNDSNVGGMRERNWKPCYKVPTLQVMWSAAAAAKLLQSCPDSV